MCTIMHIAFPFAIFGHSLKSCRIHRDFCLESSLSLEECLDRSYFCRRRSLSLWKRRSWACFQRWQKSPGINSGQDRT